MCLQTFCKRAVHVVCFLTVFAVLEVTMFTCKALIMVEGDVESLLKLVRIFYLVAAVILALFSSLKSEGCVLAGKGVVVQTLCTSFVDVR